MWHLYEFIGSFMVSEVVCTFLVLRREPTTLDGCKNNLLHLKPTRTVRDGISFHARDCYRLTLSCVISDVNFS